MVILQRLKVLIIRITRAIVLFFTKVRPNKRQSFRNLDLVEIALCLLPVTIFGCLIFGLNAVITIGISVGVCTVLASLWDIIERKKFTIDFKSALMGLFLSLTLTSGLEWYYIISVSAAAVLISKLFFRKNPRSLFYSAVIARVIFAVALYQKFTLYPLPFQNSSTVATPLTHMFDTFPFDFSAKELFFGLHTGGIGQVAESLILIGAVYLLLRRMVNPIICSVFIGGTALLSYWSNQSLPLSLLGGGLFFAAFFYTMDYGFKDTSILDKIIYGILCALTTFVTRLIFEAEAIALAIFVSNLIMQYVNKRNIKRIIKFFEKPSFAKIFKKIWKHIA